MKTKVRFILVITVVVAIGVCGYILFKTSGCQRLNCITLKDNSNYRIKDIYEENKYIFRGLYTNGNKLLRAEIKPNFSQDDANQAIQTQITRTKGVFEDAAAPYPGEISDVISCSNEYRPVYSSNKQNGINIAYFEGYVNDRLVFGSCVDDQAKYHDTLAMFYCAKHNKFYQLEIIIPRKEYVSNPNTNNEILASLGCAK